MFFLFFSFYFYVLDFDLPMIFPKIRHKFRHLTHLTHTFVFNCFKHCCLQLSIDGLLLPYYNRAYSVLF